jgi:hypothetical protein
MVMIKNMEYKHVISFGAGLNSSALIPYLLFDKNQKIDLVVFADTGNENDYTYETVNYFKDWCKNHDTDFVIAKSKLANNLYDYCYDKNVTPSRFTRNCTKNFKITPIRKAIKEKFNIKNTRKKPFHIKMYIAITSDESHRVRDSDISYIENIYPFVDDKINREGCKTILEKYELPIPKKSGCWFCPFHKQKEWTEMLQNRPDLFEKSIKLETNSKYYPKDTSLLSHIPLVDIKKKVNGSRKITDFEMSCDVVGSCFL